MPPHMTRTEHADCRRVGSQFGEESGTVLAMPGDRVTIIHREGESITDAIRGTTDQGFTELVEHYFDVTSGCDVLVYARP